MDNKIDLEFLKNRLNSHKKEDVSHDGEVSSFCHHFKIVKGFDKVETFIIKALYDKFTLNRPLKLTYIDLFRKLSYYIEKVRWGRQRYYLLDRSKLLLSSDDEFNLRINEQIRQKEYLSEKKRSALQSLRKRR